MLNRRQFSQSLAAASLLGSGAAQAQAAEPPTLDERISAVVQPYSEPWPVPFFTRCPWAAPVSHSS